MADPILSLTTLAPERPTVEIDGTLYELHVLDDFSIEEQHRLTVDGNEYDRLWSSENLTSKQEKRLSLLLNRMFEMVLIAPPEVKAKLNPSQRSQVVLAFTLAPLTMNENEAAQTEAETESPSTTES